MDRDKALSADDLPMEKVPTPEWGEGEFVYVSGLTAGEFDAYEMSLIADQEAGKGRMYNARAKYAVRAIRNDDRSRMFFDDDADALGRKSAAVVARVYSVAQRLSGSSEKEVQEIVKNSEGGHDDGSS